MVNEVRHRLEDAAMLKRQKELDDWVFGLKMIKK